MTTATAPRRLALYRYQEDAFKAVFEAEGRGVTRQVVSLPTGAGKTILAAHLIGERRPAVFLCHRDELVSQTIDKLHTFDPALTVGICKAERGRSAWELQGFDVVIASAQTLAREARLAELKKAIPDLPMMLVDECHHSSAATWARTIETLSPRLLVGLTATPKRGDGKGLDGLFQEIVYSLPMRDLVEVGKLARPIGLRVGTSVDLGAVHSRGGEFVESELSTVINTPQRNSLVVDAWEKHIRDGGRKRTIAFCVDVAHAHDLCATFRARGHVADVVTGATPTDERARMYRDLKSGELPVLISVLVLSEGFDEPLVDSALMCRPTQSQALYIQCLDSETEVLTPRGWMGDATLSDSDLVAGVHPVSGEMRWLSQKSRVRRPVRRDERMVTIKNPSLDIRVTEGHRMLVQHSSTRSRWSEPTFATAGSLVGKPGKHRIPVCGEQDVPDCELTDEECRFLGWFLSDGTLNPINNQVTISQAGSQPQIADLRRTLTACGFRFGDNERQHPDRPETRMVYFTISRGAPRRKADAHLRGWEHLADWLTPSRRLTPSYERLSVRQFALLMEGLHLGNGSKHSGEGWTRRSYHVSFGDIQQAEQIQSLAVRRGWRAHLSTWAPPEGGWGTKPVTVMHAKRISVASIMGRPSDSRPTWEYETPAPNESVWCVENEFQTLVIRRRGKVAVVGNCVGRALRQAEGKPDALIIDFVDVTARHNLQTILTLAGDAPVEEPEEGPLDLFAGVDAAEVKLAQAESRKARIRSGAELLGDLLGVAPVVWQRDGDRWFASTGAKEWISVIPFDGGFAPIRVGDGGFEFLFDRSVDAQTAMNIAQTAVPKNTLTKRDADWRNGLASEKQLRILRLPVDTFMSRGEASERIDRKFFARAFKESGASEIEETA